MPNLVPCPRCSRHIRRTEGACPFCGDSLAHKDTRERPLPSVRLGRAALVAFATLTACGGRAVTGGGETPDGSAGGDGGESGSGGKAGAGGSFGSGGKAGTGGRPGSGGAPGAGGAYMGSGGLVVAPPYGVPPLGTGGMPATKDCKDLFGGGVPTYCCPDPPPSCEGRPDGYPGYNCTPASSSYCSCSCNGGAWVCAC